MALIVPGIRIHMKCVGVHLMDTTYNGMRKKITENSEMDVMWSQKAR